MLTPQFTCCSQNSSRSDLLSRWCKPNGRLACTPLTAPPGIHRLLPLYRHTIHVHNRPLYRQCKPLTTWHLLLTTMLRLDLRRQAHWPAPHTQTSTLQQLLRSRPHLCSAAAAPAGHPPQTPSAPTSQTSSWLMHTLGAAVGNKDAHLTVLPTVPATPAPGSNIRYMTSASRHQHLHLIKGIAPGVRCKPPGNTQHPCLASKPRCACGCRPLAPALYMARSVPWTEPP